MENENRGQERSCGVMPSEVQSRLVAGRKTSGVWLERGPGTRARGGARYFYFTLSKSLFSSRASAERERHTCPFFLAFETLCSHIPPARPRAAHPLALHHMLYNKVVAIIILFNYKAASRGILKSQD